MSSSAPRYKHYTPEAFAALLGNGLHERVEDRVGETAIYASRDQLVDLLRSLRDDLHYQQLMEIAGVDYPDRSERFEVVYCLLSVTENHRVRVHVRTDETTPVPSVTGLWPVAGWLEREVFDLYGVNFSGNPDLRRILTDYGFEGHPLRKDFPQTGFVELRYSEAEKRVVYEPVDLPQDFRNFDFLMPWEGPEYRLPGDEKATVPQAPGAPSPAPAPSTPVAPAKAGPGTPKTTDEKSDTGAGEPANEAAKKEARKPAAKKNNKAGGKTTDHPDPNPADPPRRTKGGK